MASQRPPLPLRILHGHPHPGRNPGSDSATPTPAQDYQDEITELAEQLNTAVTELTSSHTWLRRLAHYYSEVNILHPFREGNGRAQCGFFELLAAESGRHIAWERLDRNEHIAAIVEAYHGREAALANLLAPLIEPRLIQRAEPAERQRRWPRRDRDDEFERGVG